MAPAANCSEGARGATTESRYRGSMDGPSGKGSEWMAMSLTSEIRLEESRNCIQL